MQNHLTILKKISGIILMVMMIVFVFSSCEVKDPLPENIPEQITTARLVFTPPSGAPVIVTATDPDNAGPEDIIVDSPIILSGNTTYSLSIELVNALYATNDANYDVSARVEEEGYEHQFFFSWNSGIFSSPSGQGNIENHSGLVNYGSSVDVNGLPVGLTTSWTTNSNPSTGNNSFRVLLKHQPAIKSATSSAADGESDLDISFTIIVN